MKKVLCVLLSVLILTSLTTAALGESQRTLTFLHWRTEDKAAYEELIAEYEAAHPDVKVEMEIIKTNDYDTTLLMRLQGGVVADVFATHLGGSFYDNVSTGGLLDLSDCPSITQNYTPDAMAYFNVDGRQYAVPQTSNAFAVYYNKDIFAKYGLEVPTTLDEFNNVCKTLHDNGVMPMAFAGGETWMCQFFFQNILVNSIADTNVWKEISNGDATLQTYPEMAEGFKFVRKLREAGYIMPESSGISEESLLTGFAVGSYAMISTGTWSMSTIRNIDSTCNFGLFNMPGTLGTFKGISHIGLSLCINSNSKVKDDAVDFVAFMTSPEAVAKLCNETGQLTPVSNVTLGNDDLQMALALLSTPDGFVSSPFRVPRNDVYDLFNAMTTEAIVADTFDVDARLAYYQSEIDKLQ